jgi:CheY-like chemotaxis protein
VRGCGLGREAATLVSTRADLLVVDTELPDMDALSVIRLVRSTQPRLPVAVYAYQEDDAAPCLKEPAVLFVPKGDDPAQLVRAVRSMLFRR